ncbi:hypothetical protein SISNIDRAFT_468143 [Sistotremastrum niveocremeum HHB9708]|uniref:Uncharacterized protein n=1 Tax=Sistotremastrum niveocremeum HHB9708 TaxID=1314777 RepID=A0A164RUL3_9AGAM|nr:hypothetical protein SISNIDRAFT_468143 [Sistotremastrum niveocremeum HHB9708]
MIPNHVDYRSRRLSQQPAQSTNPILVPHLIRTVPSPGPSSSPQSPHPVQPHPTQQLSQQQHPTQTVPTSQIRNQYHTPNGVSQAGYQRNSQNTNTSYPTPGISSHASPTSAPSQNDWRRLRLHNLPPRMRSKSGAMRSPPSATPTGASGGAVTVSAASSNNGITPSYSFSAETFADQFGALSLDSPHPDDQDATSMNSCSAVSSSDHQHRLARSPTTSTSSSFVSANSFIYHAAPPLVASQSQALAPPMVSVKTPNVGGPVSVGRPSRNLPPRLQRSAPDLRNRAQRQNQGPAASYSNSLTHSRSIGHSSQSSHSQHSQIPPLPPLPNQTPTPVQQHHIQPYPHPQHQSQSSQQPPPPGQRQHLPPSPTSTETDSGSADSHSLITPPPSTHTTLQTLGQTIYQSAQPHSSATPKLSRKEKQQQQVLSAWTSGAKSISSTYSHASSGSGSGVISGLGREAYSSSSLYSTPFIPTFGVTPSVGSGGSLALGQGNQTQYLYDQGSDENIPFYNGGRTRKESHSGMSAGHAGAGGLGSVAEFEYEYEIESADDGHGGDDGDEEDFRSASHHGGAEYVLERVPEDTGFAGQIQAQEGHGVRQGLKRRGSYVPNPAFDPFSSVNGDCSGENESMGGESEAGHEDEDELEVLDHDVHLILGNLGGDAELDIPLGEYQSRSVSRNFPAARSRDHSPHPQLSSAGYQHQPWGVEEDHNDFDRTLNSGYAIHPSTTPVAALVTPKKNTHDIRALPPGAGASIPPSLSMFSSRPAMVGLPMTTSTAFTATAPMRSPWS